MPSEICWSVVLCPKSSYVQDPEQEDTDDWQGKILKEFFFCQTLQFWLLNEREDEQGCIGFRLSIGSSKVADVVHVPTLALQHKIRFETGHCLK